MLKKAKYRHFRVVLEDFLDNIPWSVWFWFINKISILKNPVLVPVPMSASDKKQRGYNQSGLIANYLNYYLALPINSCLIKTKNTKKQSMLQGLTERRRNIRGVFQLKKNTALKGQNLVLVDDVITTAATITEAGKVLKRAGVETLIAFSLFRAR